MAKFSTKYGSFSDDGLEYVITNPAVPKPWVNVLTNGSYGLVISQTGGGFSWDVHSEFNRLTRWHQDLIQDNWGKYVYIRNNATGEVWSPTWLPVKADLSGFRCTHGIGYTTFVTVHKNITVELTIFVPFDDSLEIWDITCKNENGTAADLSFITYFEWAIGSSADFHREFHKQFLETAFHPGLNGLTATKRLWEIPLGDRGHWNIEYPYLTFHTASKPITAYEGDKEAFIGMYRSLRDPIAVMNNEFEMKTGKWNDSIGSLKVDCNIPSGSSERFRFFLGLKSNPAEIQSALEKFSTDEKVDAALQDVKNRWRKMLGTLHIETPDDAMNISVNTWLRYQAIAGRLWGRTAYYQQSGAFGFRDQLQDSMVYLPIDPNLTANQIKLHARHQFKDGSVLHWWHPISDTGLPTNMTDDLLWLPFLVHQYIQETADYTILDAVEPFYDDPETKADIYTHCVRAFEKTYTRISPRGIPLIGAGDWNDGLSAVGLEWKGESFWLASFLFGNLNSFSAIAHKRGNTEHETLFTKQSAALKESFSEHAWDGEWYVRATKDTGEPLGSSACEEGKIFLNAQTWPIITGLGEADKNEKAFDAVLKHLFKKNGALLLHPAYSSPDKYIGYLSRYAPGRRENGGVYSHAATWFIWAAGLLKKDNLPYESFRRLCPILSGLHPDEYVAEPYVMPGNIDGPDSVNYGMAGWTWYTGSAAWFQKVIVEWILGVRASEEGLVIDPCIPPEWKKYSVKRLFRGTEYHITFTNENGVSHGVKQISVDGEAIEGSVITPSKSAKVKVEVILG